jgi:hypothetical protein
MSDKTTYNYFFERWFNSLFSVTSAKHVSHGRLKYHRKVPILDHGISIALWAAIVGLI